MNEQETEKISGEFENKKGADFLTLTTPEGSIIPVMAIIIDATGFFGFPWLFIPHLFFGFWLMIRGSFQSAEEQLEQEKTRQKSKSDSKKDSSHSKAPPEKAKTAKTAKTAKKVKWIRWLRALTFVGELIPIINIIPFWTILVYCELLYNSK